MIAEKYSKLHNPSFPPCMHAVGCRAKFGLGIVGQCASHSEEGYLLMQGKRSIYTLGHPLIRDILLNVFLKVSPAGGPIL